MYAKPPGEGEPCADPAGCDLSGDFCDLVALKCTARQPLGGPCDQRSQGCVRYAFCDTSGTCVARGALGQPCNVAEGTCLPGLLCEIGTCVRFPTEPTCPQP